MWIAKPMKILVRAFLMIGSASMALFMWDSARFVVAPRSTTHSIAGFNIPAGAKLVTRGGDSNEPYFKWQVDPAFTETLGAPRGAGNSTDWQPFGLDFSGGLEGKDVAADAEALYYRTSFWSVALIRSKSERSLIVAGIYTN